MTTGTQHQFGYQWARFDRILPLHEEQFRRWIAPLEPSFFQGKTFLDAGCGMGRNSYWPLQAGATKGYAFDYDERTVAAAQRNLADFPQCEVAFRSIYELDLDAEVDVAFSIGVVHHLAEPRKAVENLVKAVKPGGTLILWLYAHEGNERYLWLIDPLRRHLTSRIPPGLTRMIARSMAVALRMYLMLPHQKPYLKLLREMSFRYHENIIFDQLIPSIAYYWTREEVLELVAGLPLENFRLTHTNGMSWTLVADKCAEGTSDRALEQAMEQ